MGYKYILIASKKISCCLLLILNQFSLIKITHRWGFFFFFPWTIDRLYSFENNSQIIDRLRIIYPLLYWCSSLQPTKSYCISWYQSSSYFSWMGKSNYFADMNEVHVRTETACKEQSTIRLRRMSGGPNNCRRNQGGSILSYVVSTRRPHYPNIQLVWSQRSGSRNPFTERWTHGRQHLAQTHENQRVSRFKLSIPEFQGDPQPEEFLDWVLTVEEAFEFNRVPNERQVSLVVHTF